MSIKKYANVIMKDFPIILVELSEVSPTPELVDMMFDDLVSSLDKTTGHYVIISPYNGKFIPSEARVKLGQMARAMHEKYKDRELGSIIVSESPVVRIMLQTINALFRPHSNHQRIVSSREKAYAYAQELLDKATASIS